jgi:hypothetical protein
MAGSLAHISAAGVGLTNRDFLLRYDHGAVLSFDADGHYVGGGDGFEGIFLTEPLPLVPHPSICRNIRDFLIYIPT